ncbi:MULTISPECIES: BREX-1 system adenine-specific DNA-methyltransferase PglX [Bacillus cereus group]|uniref:site-specific DNA-methyltransferase (adenine-specific) n=3 Tax=Bacillus cereus TaxID=1396 RepID=A0ABD4LKG8_BACCE|nr:MULTISPECIES: BREX-1 system adenine-specific DNA-methyltransferase PglX [Bacillus cereus group]MBK1610872.1 BREX-1 system adenine-specific DNA-methyltransferase PglX [Bacillus cereus]MBR9693636.1 SAM-dependent methyltransferase [Bacillus cereus]MEC0074454.1 BREX-1 system adenine-specific DNA-methyltransferase PglX [Bacillus anthracis]MEC0096541.1 BREX-1 system adenine-specific DNA-methyltransferase PglX [Bacillus anthracis]HDX9662744.1 BREX-1 system adenine-specific DNA-methyltransferase Pg
MNKKALKEFAVYARNELREQIALRAQAFGITPEGSPVLVTGADYVEINDKKYPIVYKNSIQKLLKEIETKGYDNVIEEVAYTWFNRLIAIRYMEVHNYLPSKVRVLSSETKEKVDPDILTEYQYTDLPVNKEVASLLAQGNREEAFRKLLVAQCNELNDIMPFLFEKLADYTELLLPESLLHADSLINKLGKELDDEDFEHVEVIGWLYQYYISEKKDEVFAGLKKNKKITKENIPAATQLFTPHWIVRYMVENSLGHMWLESHPDSEVKEEMKYYVEPAEQELEVQAKLEELQNPNLSPEEITVLDPACGSGHILVYAFDLLYKIYEERGYPTKEIPTLILEKNLYGIDIDDRAAQLASFALMMKAREKTKRIFRNVPKLNIISIQESNSILIEQAADLIGENDNEKEEIKDLLTTFIDAKNFGSILQPEKVDADKYIRKIIELNETGERNLENFEVYEQLDKVKEFIVQAKILSLQYDVVITNPPYMGTNSMNLLLRNYLKKKYPETKNDLFAVFMERGNSFTRSRGFHASINQHSWMFLGSYEKLRGNIISNLNIYSMIHLGPKTFEEIGGEIVQSTAFVLRNERGDYKGSYIRLTDIYNSIEKETAFLNRIKSYVVDSKEFYEIPGKPISYWISKKVREIFKNSKVLREYGEPREGMATADNNKFLRFWNEVEFERIGFGFKSRQEANTSKLKWFPYNKGGEYRKWYGNRDLVVNWQYDGQEIRNNIDANGRIRSHNYNLEFIFKEHITWTAISSGDFSSRWSPEGALFDSKGKALFPFSVECSGNLLGFMNSKVFNYLIGIISSTMDFNPGQVGVIPYLDQKDARIDSIVREQLNHSRTDWDSFETSWDFQKHPFLTYYKKNNNIEQCYTDWETHTETQFCQLQQNEEELNKIFIEMYGLQDELTPEVLDENITIRRADRVRDTKSFLSYCIGLMMGRYSLDVDGLVYAGGDWDASKYKTFQPDSDGIIPLTDTEYFEDDVVSRLQELLVIMFGQDTLAENLRWLAESLTMKNNETPVERLRRYFFDEFYSDHCKIYQKRPIYWMADSGKKKGFRSLFYLHRYTPETLATMRFSYVQNLQEKLCQEQKRLEQDLVNPDLTAAMKKRFNKQLTTIKAQQDELIDFDKKMAELANQRIALDLDDGVVVNYEKLKNVLAKIK